MPISSRVGEMSRELSAYEVPWTFTGMVSDGKVKTLACLPYSAYGFDKFGTITGLSS